mmetsp:Transcript_62943/g.172505  ORF Transcript_62943/g.172505 Transcript_62943/m.172505 type:complete len:258 (+) Transcript_62943:1002-1775(+)
MDVRVPWFFASTQMQHREPGLVMERFQTRCRSSHSRYGKHMVQMRPHTPLACGHPHFCQGAKSKKEAEPGAMFVVHYATRSFEEFTGKPQRKVGGGLGRNHTFEFFAKNSCRWTMSKDQRTRERRMKNFPPFNPKGASGMYDSLKTELGRSDRTEPVPGIVKVYADVTARCISDTSSAQCCPRVAHAAQPESPPPPRGRAPGKTTSFTGASPDPPPPLPLPVSETAPAVIEPAADVPAADARGSGMSHLAMLASAVS